MGDSRINFTQGVTTDGPGVALMGTTGVPVHVSNGDDDNIANWTFEVRDVGFGSTVAQGVVQDGTTPTWVFDPDVPGGYTLRLTTTDKQGNIYVDERVFGVLEGNGLFIPPFEANAASMNFKLAPGVYNGKGWSPYLGAWLRLVAAGGGVVLADAANPSNVYAAPPLGTWAPADTGSSHGQVVMATSVSPCTGNHATMIGGKDSACAGDFATVLGGHGGSVGGTASVVLGGENNATAGKFSCVVGGFANQADGDFSSAGGLLAQSYQKFQRAWANGDTSGAQAQLVDGLVLTGSTPGSGPSETTTLVSDDGTGAPASFSTVSSVPKSFALKAVATANGGGDFASWEFLLALDYDGANLNLDAVRNQSDTPASFTTTVRTGGAAAWTLTPSVLGTELIWTFVDVGSTALCRATVELRSVEVKAGP